MTTNNAWVLVVLIRCFQNIYRFSFDPLKPNRWRLLGYGSHPPKYIVFTRQNVRNAIYQLQCGKALDHDGLVGEHFIHVVDIIASTYL